MVAGVPRAWYQNRALGPPAPRDPHPAGTGRESEGLEGMQQPFTVGSSCWHGGEIVQAGWGKGNQRRKLRENSEEREAGRAALGPTIKHK